MSLPRVPSTIMAAMSSDAAGADAEVLSWDVIRERHPNEWVILVDLVKEDHHTAGGRVLAHSPDKDALRTVARGLRGAAILWTGELGSPRLFGPSESHTGDT